MSSISSFILSVLIFAKIHPGLLLVLVGVAGEIFLDWRHADGKSVWLKKAFWVLLVLGLMLEFGEAAQTDNEVIALNKKIVQIAPENLRINSLRADVSLWIRDSDLANVPGMAKGEMPKEPIEFALSDSVADALNPSADFLVMMDCESFDEGGVIDTPEGRDFSHAIKVRSFAMTFSWPGVGFTDGHFAVHPNLRPWIYGNVSTADLDKKHPVAFISLDFMPANAEILRGTCVLTINGEIKRNFAIPAKTDVMRIVFPPMPFDSR